MKSVLSITFLLLAHSAAHAQTFSLDARLALRGTSTSGPPSWLEYGAGRYAAGRNDAGLIAELGGDWVPSKHFNVHAHAIARAEPSRFDGSQAGLVEGFAEVLAGNWQIRAGQMFLPTSRENTDPLWSSPYLLSLSSWNSWIGEELRPIGVDAQWKRGALTVGATGFIGNDTNGTLLGWRGWSVGNRLAVNGETLPVEAPAPFVAQRRGTTAFGRDLDGRPGFALRTRLSLPDRALVQLTHVDNRGDRGLHRAEYAWQTRFDAVAIEAGSRERFKVAAELARGKTGMGFAPHAFVQADFYAGYLLLSQKIARTRLSARYDLFATLERDHSIGGNTTEHGRAWAIAWLFDLTDHVRGGVEFTQVTGRRDVSFDGRALSVELRYSLK